jgi:sugar phosphate isomerase/epimerase
MRIMSTRRDFLGRAGLAAGGILFAPRTLAAAARAVRAGGKFRLGVTDWNLKLEGDPKAVALAKACGFDGVQISLSNRPSGTDWLGPAVLDQFVAESKRLGLPIASVCLNILHRNYLKSDPLGVQRVADSIGMARRVGVQVVLLPFFGPGALKTPAEMDYVGDLLKELGPQAARAGVVLGLENTISARDNVRIMERSQSPAVKTYYDVGNSIKQGFDIVEEIRWLGNERICEVHLKDNPHYLGEGPINFPAVIDALGDIGFDKWAELETDCPSKDVQADMTRNLAYLRGLIQARS